MKRYERLTRDDESNTRIMAGHSQLSIKQLEDEQIDPNSEIGRKLKTIEDKLEMY